METIINNEISFTTIPISFDNLEYLCDDKKRCNDIINEEYKEITNFINSFCFNEKIDFYKSIQIITDINLNNKLQFSIEGIIYTLLNILNYDNIYSIDKLLDSTKILKNIDNTNQLKSLYPLLYKKYNNYKKQYSPIKRVVERVDKANISKTEKYKVIKDFISSINICDDVTFELVDKACSFNIKSFCEFYALSIENILLNLDKIKDYLKKTNINYERVGINNEKLKLYLAYNTLYSINKVSKLQRKYCIKYLKNYFEEKESRKKDTFPTLYFDKNKESINPSEIYFKYHMILINNPELKSFHESTDNYVLNNLKKLGQSWDIFLDDDEKLEILKQNLMNQDLIELYSDLESIYIIKGKNQFEGYFGIVSSKGTIIIDTINSIDKYKDEIRYSYYIDIEDLVELNKHDNKNLIESAKVHKISHRGLWTEKIKRVFSNNDYETNKSYFTL